MVALWPKSRTNSCTTCTRSQSSRHHRSSRLRMWLRLSRMTLPSEWVRSNFLSSAANRQSRRTIAFSSLMVFSPKPPRTVLPPSQKQSETSSPRLRRSSFRSWPNVDLRRCRSATQTWTSQPSDRCSTATSTRSQTQFTWSKFRGTNARFSFCYLRTMKTLKNTSEKCCSNASP